MVGIGVVWANLNNTVDDLKQTQRELADRFDREALDRKERQKIYHVTMDG
jgi:2'-5' RNA ligase